MTSALIGFSGFVGRNLARSADFDLLVNSANLESLQGAHIDRLVCAGLPAAKWIANQKPVEDAQNVRRLERTLKTLQASTVVVISTIDVYPSTHEVDESYDCSGITNHPYGTHRLEFEHFVRSTFPHAFIVRLPALFGPGMKKNILHDLLNGNRLERINVASRFQWYPIERLPQDLHVVERIGLRLVNLFTEPIVTGAIVDELFPAEAIGRLPDTCANYDLHTRYGREFGGNEKYVMTASAVMQAMRRFVLEQRVSRCSSLSPT